MNTSGSWSFGSQSLNCTHPTPGETLCASSSHPWGILLLWVICLVVAVWAIVDAARRPREAHVAAGSPKELWITLIAVFAVAGGIGGLILAIVYLAVTRRRVRDVTPLVLAPESDYLDPPPDDLLRGM